MKYIIDSHIKGGYNVINKDSLTTICLVPNKNPRMATLIAKLLSEDSETKLMSEYPETVRTVWILTREFNVYDQCGEYFVSVFHDKPTHQQLTEQGVPTNRLRHVLDGGGRKDDEDDWYLLKLTQCL